MEGVARTGLKQRTEATIHRPERTSVTVEDLNPEGAELAAFTTLAVIPDTFSTL